MDDEIEFRMPHCPTPFWTPTSTGTFLGQEYHSGNPNFAGNTIPVQHTYAHTHPVFLSVNHEEFFDDHSANLVDYQLGLHHSCNDHSANLVDYQLGLHHSCNGLTDILGLSDTSGHNGEPLTQIWPASSGMSEKTSFGYSSYCRDFNGSFSIPNPDPPVVSQDDGRNYGAHRNSLPMNPGRDENGSLHQKEPPKARRRQRSRRQQTPTQQEEAGRRLRLERNRNTAARSRLKKKKWIYDITAKVNVLKDKYKSQRSQRNELEQEIQQLKLMLFLHSRSCNDDDIGLWIEEELKRVKDVSKYDVI